MVTIDTEEYWARAREIEESASRGLAPGVYLYEHIDFGGEVLHITADVPHLGQQFGQHWNDRVSSWQVVGDYSVVGFEHVNFTGGRSYLPSGGACTNMRPLSLGAAGAHGCMGQVRNDIMSSVGVGTAAFNKYLEPLCWPKNEWLNTAGGVTYGFQFSPDHTYRLIEVGDAVGVITRGTWHTVDNPWAGLLPHIVTRNNTTVTSGSALPVPAPDAIYRYFFHPGEQSVEINFRGTMMTFG